MVFKLPVFSFYRHYLRQVKRLPHYYLRQFFRIKASDDFRALAATPTHKSQLRNSRIKRISKDLRRIGLAVTGRQDAFSYILDLAYGRRGKLKWELMEPLLTQANVPSLPEPIIHSRSSSRPPVYSAELSALLINTASRTNKSLELHQLKFPPTLSSRANPTSEEARLLGPLSKRLEFNTRWRYFTREWKKVYPPLEIAVKGNDGLLSTSVSDVLRAEGKIVGSQDQGFLDGIKEMVGPPTAEVTPITRRERLLSGIQQFPGRSERHHPSRWIRRRYQALLGRVPVLILNPSFKKPTFSVSLPLNSIALVGRNAAHRRPFPDSCNLAWLERANDKPRPNDKSRSNT
ncbi:hypothetical protein C8J55DRAFT_472377 [Lentinula edodes]|uniref:LYR motif-containing protein Cup1-like N-terminal domain-containing protein n=1 Tax=Lentinula lateritia TaxID=40482 RepID=A0A9W9DT78_9AGAR|nr:hypothetical protein C8J55DRAFT_472377 [Lentinula edodes]